MACLAAWSLHGQVGQITAPSAGFVFDPPARTLRRIQGVPGAALVGTPVDFGFAVSAAYVAPRLDSAFVVGTDGRARFFRLAADTPVESPIDPLGSPQRVVFSPSGTAAALYSPGSVQVVKGLPDAPVAGAAIRLRGNPTARRPVLDTLAISDDGAYLLYAAGGPLELLGVAGNRRQIASGAASFAAFAPGGHDAAVIQSGKLIFYQDIAGAATERSLPGIEAPSALAFSPDGQTLFVASATGRAITAVQVATGNRAALSCNCAPAALIPMGPLFRLNELGAEPLWLLDTAPGHKLVFVPAPAAN